jgi:hypothetical protein
VARDKHERKWKKHCCEKPRHKACKRCPRRRSDAAPSEAGELPTCIVMLLRR